MGVDLSVRSSLSSELFVVLTPSFAHFVQIQFLGKSRKLALTNRSLSAVTADDGFPLVEEGPSRESKGREGVKLEFLGTARASPVVLPLSLCKRENNREVRLAGQLRRKGQVFS